MRDLKLPKLPDRTTVKISFQAAPDLNQLLQEYAEFYRERYGQEEPVAELIPYMLETFLRSDSSFIKSRRERLRAASQPAARRGRVRGQNAAASSS